MTTPHQHQLTLRVKDRSRANELKNRLSFGPHPVGMGPIKLMRWDQSDHGWDGSAKITFQLTEGAPRRCLTGVFEILRAAGTDLEQLLLDGKVTTVAEALKSF